MVAQLLRLKLQLTLNTFRRSVWQIVGLVLAVLGGIAVIVLAASGLLALQRLDAEVARNLMVIAGSLVVTGFLLLPLVLGADDQLDPRAFSLFGFRPRRLAVGLFAVSLIGVPSLVVTALSVTAVVAWSRGSGPVMFAVISAVLAVLTCALLGRITTSVAASLLSSSRARGAMGVIGIILIVAISPVIVALTAVDWQAEGFAVLGRVADILSWTPFGAVWSLPGDAAMGNTGAAVVKMLLVVVTLALLWLIWERIVAKLLVTTDRPGTSREHGGLGWFDLLAGRPAGVIAARSVTYWLRDPRYLVSLMIIPIVPFLFFVPLLVAGVPVGVLALIPLPIMCLFLGWAAHNDLAYDSTAVWLHVVSGVRGRADRLGRLFPVLLVGIPLVLAGSTLSIFFFGDWDALPGMIGVSSCLLLSGAGISSITSARFPYHTTQPGDSPFQQPQTSGTVGAIVQALSLLGAVICTIPAGWMAMLGLNGDPNWHMGALAVGLGVGFLMLLIGVLGGGRIFDRRSPEIVGFATSH